MGWVEVEVVCVVMLGFGLGLMVWEFKILLVSIRCDDGAWVVMYDHCTYALSVIPAYSVPREQRWLCGR